MFFLDIFYLRYYSYTVIPKRRSDMKKLIKMFCCLLFVCFFCGCDSNSDSVGKVEKSVPAELEWMTDFEQVKARARAENKPILLVFSGSDWCGWCIKLDREVFSTDEFKKWAADNIVCMIADFPAVKKIEDKLKQQNEQLRDSYNVAGYPTVLLLKDDGTVIARSGYLQGGPAKYIRHLKVFIGAAK